MTRFVNKVKLAWLKGVEVVATSASNLASNAKFKVAEINLETRRREIMAEFTQKAYELWQNGIVLPEPLHGMLQEASDLNERLSVLRAQRYAAVGEDTENPQREDIAGVDEDGVGNGIEVESTATVAGENEQSDPDFLENAEAAFREATQEPATPHQGEQSQEP